MIHTDLQGLQPMPEELNRQNPQVLRLIEEQQDEFVRLLNETVEAEEPARAIHRAVILTPEEYEAVQRLEAMGFGHAVVIEAFLACDKNEQLAANYLLDH
ncbi:hypothetical protein SUGI_0690800 [Cryptomeria japonica]|nr:hypothetical protein SUGI_0690800 [Cryptomeria japonica]